MLDRFVVKHPLTVMTRAILARVVDERLDELFDQHRGRQYDATIKFSTLALSVAEIALTTIPNRNQAYEQYREELQVSKAAYYAKCNRCEPSVSEAVVRHGAEQAAALLAPLDFQPWEVLAGYRCLTIDGNHLQQTEKRLSETRGLCAAPLPGTVVARYDHQTGLFDRAYLLEDAHAQESSVLERVLADAQPRDLFLADRHFCIVDFLERLAQRGSCFVIRQHGRLAGKSRGKRRFIGRSATGDVYEEPLALSAADDALVLRQIVVVLDQPTRDGATELRLLSNVPEEDAAALALAEIYHQRWEIENAFHTLTMTFACESPKNCVPRGALLQFCLALVAYNCRQVLLASLYAEHAQADVEAMSQHQVARDIVVPMEGLLTAVDEEEWERLVPRSVAGVARFLRQVSSGVNVKRYRKSVRGPKKPAVKRTRCTPGTHVATARLLKKRARRR
jgi:GTP cyclohydrolase II